MPQLDFENYYGQIIGIYFVLIFLLGFLASKIIRKFSFSIKTFKMIVETYFKKTLIIKKEQDIVRSLYEKTLLY